MGDVQVHVGCILLRDVKCHASHYTSNKNILSVCLATQIPIEYISPVCMCVEKISTMYYGGGEQTYKPNKVHIVPSIYCK